MGKGKKTIEISSFFLQNQCHHSCYEHLRQQSLKNWYQVSAIMRNCRRSRKTALKVWRSPITDDIISMKPKISHNAGEEKLSWEIMLFAFLHRKPLVVHIINRFWENIDNTPPWRNFIHRCQAKWRWMKRWLEDSRFLLQKTHLEATSDAHDDITCFFSLNSYNHSFIHFHIFQKRLRMKIHQI